MDKNELLNEAQLLEKICGTSPEDKGLVQDLIRKLGLPLANSIYRKCVEEPKESGKA